MGPLNWYSAWLIVEETVLVAIIGAVGLCLPFSGACCTEKLTADATRHDLHKSVRVMVGKIDTAINWFYFFFCFTPVSTCSDWTGLKCSSKSNRFDSRQFWLDRWWKINQTKNVSIAQGIEGKYVMVCQSMPLVNETKCRRVLVYQL